MRCATLKPLALFFLGAVLAPSGCSDGKDPHGRHTLSGTVTFKEQPLSEGHIRILALEENGLSAGAMIREGKFTIPRDEGLPPGTYRVQISSLEPTPIPTGAPGENPAPPAKDRIPPEYNRDTKLKIEVKKDQDNKFEFTIK